MLFTPVYAVLPCKSAPVWFFRLLWSNMFHYGTFCAIISPYGSLWVLMGHYGSLWVTQVPSGLHLFILRFYDLLSLLFSSSTGTTAAFEAR